MLALTSSIGWWVTGLWRWACAVLWCCTAAEGSDDGDHRLQMKRLEDTLWMKKVSVHRFLKYIHDDIDEKHTNWIWIWIMCTYTMTRVLGMLLHSLQAAYLFPDDRYLGYVILDAHFKRHAVYTDVLLIWSYWVRSSLGFFKAVRDFNAI